MDLYSVSKYWVLKVSNKLSVVSCWEGSSIIPEVEIAVVGRDDWACCSPRGRASSSDLKVGDGSLESVVVAASGAASVFTDSANVETDCDLGLLRTRV